jgi:hypothetical protein
MRDLQLVSHVRSPVYEIGTMRLLSAIPSAVLTITTAGFVATVAQIIVLRELLVLFYGNELSAGLIFAGWLLWRPCWV